MYVLVSIKLKGTMNTFLYNDIRLISLYGYTKFLSIWKQNNVETFKKKIKSDSLSNIIYQNVIA